MSEKQRGMFARIRTLIVVTLLTLMVWLLAESRMVQSNTIEAQVTIASVEPSGGVEFVVRQSPNSIPVRTVTLEIEGSTAGLDRFARQLQNNFELRVGREISPIPGTYTLDLRSILRASPDLDVHGVTIKEVNPPEIIVEVDELETREFRVGVQLPDGVQTDGSIRVEPASVRLRAPSTVLAALESQDATVTLSAAQIAQLTPGRYETVPGGVVEIENISVSDWSTTIEPAQVDVLLELKTVTQQLELDPLPIQVVIAPGEVGDWSVEIDDSDRDLVGVLIEGPVEDIEALRSGLISPKAFVSLSFEDLERGITSQKAEIMYLPAGCRVISPERDIGLRIARKNAPDSTPAQPGENQGP